MQHAVFHTIAFLAFSCLAFSASPLEIGLLTATFRECEISFSHRPCWTSIALKKVDHSLCTRVCTAQCLLLLNLAAFDIVYCDLTPISFPRPTSVIHRPRSAWPPANQHRRSPSRDGHLPCCLARFCLVRPVTPISSTITAKQLFVYLCRNVTRYHRRDSILPRVPVQSVVGL